MTIDQDLEKIALQEKKLQFQKFDSSVAWAIGTALKAEAEKRGVSVSIDIQLGNHPLFSYAMPGTTPDNLDWIRRKKNVVNRYHRSSYSVGLKHEKSGTTLQNRAGLELKDYAPHGGCFPILLAGTGCVGTITVSGLPQRDDHMMVVEVLQTYLKLSGEDLALGPATNS
ncbi:MAG TPA: heme-degrading domain-containing protein [Candidatus Acidoferrales bacterium]